MSQTIGTTGRTFAVIAFVEAGTWVGLLVGMILKHVTDTTELGVRIFGPIHGIAFLAYALVTMIAAVRLRWNATITVVALGAGIPPLATIPLERWLRRTGRLTTAQPVAAAQPVSATRAD
jgi:integral membrane protein